MRDNGTADGKATELKFERYGGWAAIAWLFLGLVGLAALVARESTGVSDRAAENAKNIERTLQRLKQRAEQNPETNSEKT